MGLLDDVMTNPLVGEIMQQLAVSEEQKKAAKMQAIAQFGMGLLGTPKGREGRAIGQSGIGAMQGYQQGLQGARDENLDKFKMRQLAMQMAEQERLRKQKEADIVGLAGIFGGPPSSQAAPPSPLQAMGPGGPTPQNLERVQSAAAAPPAQSDPRVAQYRQAAAHYAARGNVEAAAKYSKIADDMEAGDQFDTTPRTGMRDGKPYNYVLNKRGGVKQLDYEPAPDNQVVDLKDRSVILDKLRTPAGTSLAYGQSPDSKASNAVQWARLTEDKRHRGVTEAQGAATAALGKWQYDTERGGLVNMQTGEFKPAVQGGQPIGAKGETKNRENAGAALAIIEQAEKLIGGATGSYAGAAADKGAQLFGFSPDGADVIAQLQALEGALMLKQPRMEGPQGVLDVQLYKQMAGKIGDPTVPVSQKKAALAVIKRLHNRYPGSHGGGTGGWSIEPAN